MLIRIVALEFLQRFDAAIEVAQMILRDGEVVANTAVFVPDQRFRASRQERLQRDAGFLILLGVVEFLEALARLLARRVFAGRCCFDIEAVEAGAHAAKVAAFFRGQRLDVDASRGTGKTDATVLAFFAGLDAGDAVVYAAFDFAGVAICTKGVDLEWRVACCALSDDQRTPAAIDLIFTGGGRRVLRATDSRSEDDERANSDQTMCEFHGGGCRWG